MICTVYIISNPKRIYYKGYTTDVVRWLEEHNSPLGKYTSERGPWFFAFINIYLQMRQLFCYLTILLLLSSCGQPTKYVVKNNLVYFQGWNEAKGNYEVLLEGVSAKSFKVIDTDCNMIVGKDNQNVFIDYSKLENAHAPSFEYIGNYFFKSKDSVYFFGFYSSFNDCEVLGVNPKTFRVDKKYPWAYDGHFVVYGHTILDSVDFDSFKVIDKLKAQDKYADYVEGERVVRK